MYTLLKCNEHDASPHPFGHGWIMVDGICQPQQFTVPSLPTSRHHILTTAEQLKTHTEDENADSIADAASIERDDLSSDDEE